jgi:hypothetical protein
MTEEPAAEKPGNPAMVSRFVVIFAPRVDPLRHAVTSFAEPT